MAIVTGVVEGVSTKYDKYSVLVGGTWYATKMEWATVKPEKGDLVSFDNKGAKFLNNVKITSKAGYAGANAAAGGSSGSSGSSSPPKNFNLGVELGHASNLAMRMTEFLAEHDINLSTANEFLDVWERNTALIYARMQRLRKMYEEGAVQAEGKAAYVKDEIEKFEKPKARAKAEVEDYEIPF
jgi:hypothetical protein